MGRRRSAYPNLAAEMRRHGETQGDLARLLGFKTQAPISLRMCGKTEWTLHEVECISSHYGKSYDELFKTGETEDAINS